jgi:hypothetical protein
MDRSDTRIARQVERSADCTVVPLRGSCMHRTRIRTTVGASASLIAVFQLLPWPYRSAEPAGIDPDTRHGLTDSDAEQRKGSP